MGYRMNDADKQAALARYEKGDSSEEIAKDLGFSGVAIRNFLKRSGVTIRGPVESHRIYRCNEDAFSPPLNEDAQYWVGALLADGYIIEGKDSSPSVSLHVKDKDWVEGLKGFLEAEHPIRTTKYRGRPYFTLSIKSKKMAGDLARLGVVPRKSHTANPPEDLLHSPHFWRGMVDGDGEVDDGNNCPMINLTGSLQSVEAFCAFASTLIPDYEPYIKRSMHRSSTHHADYHGQGAKVLLQALYGVEGPAMDRKKKKALALLEKYRGKNFRVMRGRYMPKAFPYSYRDGVRGGRDFDKLKGLDTAAMHEPLFGRKTSSLSLEGFLAKSRIGYYAAGYFSERLRMSSSYKGALSPVDAWEIRRDKIIKEAASRKHSSIRASLFANCRAVYGFPPAVVKFFCDHFKWGRFLDPCAGWGDRLLGACASEHCHEYWGVDPHKDAHTIYQGIKSAYSKGKDIQLREAPFEDVELPTGHFDGVFTSPPYFDLETYSQDEGQSSLKYPEFESWAQGFLKPLVQKSFAALVPGGHFCINIADTRGGPPITQRLQQEAAFAGFVPDGVVAMRIGNFDKEHEPIWIWQKPA